MRPSSTLPKLATALATLLLAATTATVAGPASATSAGAGEAPGAATSAQLDGLTAVAAGGGHSCGIESTSGSIWCWGAGNEGQLGTGAAESSLIPVPVKVTGTVLDGAAIDQVVTGSRHACALTDGGKVACWGRGVGGQIGDGDTQMRATPTAIATTGTPLQGKQVAVLSAGYDHTCALATDDTLACWGSSNQGQLGDGDTVNRSKPVAVVRSGTPLDGAKILQLETGGANTCVVTDGPELACWGSGLYGALGVGGTANSPVPLAPTTTGTPLAGKAVAEVSVGFYSTCARTTDHVLACWGLGTDGQLGNGAAESKETAVAVATAGTPLDGAALVELSSGAYHRCARTDDAVVACWGMGTRVGDGSAGDASTPVAIDVSGALAGQKVTGLTGGDEHTCADTIDARPVCWGRGASGRLGSGYPSTERSPVAVVLAPEVPGAPTIDAVEPGDGSLAVSWSEPTDDGGTQIEEYEVVVRDGGTVVDTQRIDDLEATIGGLANGTAHDVTVAAINAVGVGPASAAATATPLPTIDRTSYVPITPCRIVDTRQAGGRFGNREIRDYAVTGSGAAFAAQGGKADGCAIPDDALAVEASITAVDPLDSGFFRAWPSGESMPNATFMNFDRGMDITNTGAITIRPATADQLRARNFGGATHYVIDVQGYYLDPLAGASGATTQVAPTGTRYRPITPCRILDTRQAGGRLANREIRDVAVVGSGPAFAAQGGTAGGCAVPEGAALAVEASITAVDPLDSGFFRAWPSGQSMPNATFMNFDRAMDITNTGSITILETGVENLRIRNFGGASHYVIDIQGYWVLPIESGATTAGVGTDASDYVPMVPCRIVDTRQAGGRLANREIRSVRVTGSGSAFAAQGGTADGCAIPAGAVAVEASITAVDPLDSGFFRAWPSSLSMPNATFMNFDRGMDITNTGSITLDLDDVPELRIRNFGGASHYVIDVQGYHLAAT